MAHYQRVLIPRWEEGGRRDRCWGKERLARSQKAVINDGLEDTEVEKEREERRERR
jgi:hypothetical protein